MKEMVEKCVDFFPERERFFLVPSMMGRGSVSCYRLNVFLLDRTDRRTGEGGRGRWLSKVGWGEGYRQPAAGFNSGMGVVGEVSSCLLCIKKTHDTRRHLL